MAISPKTRRNPWLRLAIFSLAASLFLVGYWWGNQYKQPETPRVDSAVLLRPTLHLPDFRATDHHGNDIGLTSFAGHWVLLLPARLAGPHTERGLTHLTRIYNRLAAYPKVQRKLKLVLLSPAPLADTRERLRDIVHAYNPNMDAAAGKPDDLAGLFAALGIDAAGNDNPALYLLDPQGRALAVFTTRDNPATIADDLRAIQEATPQP